jgi:D-alanyl-D-alanine carboxypeptidase/D-alanyl-D-alanine-endopeptidase (penicillin-binding protein 4)
MQRLFSLLLILVWEFNIAQSLPERLSRAVQQLQTNPGLKHGLVGFCVLNQNTGKIIYEQHGQVGMTPASCQKLFTSIAAFDLLGPNYRYLTELGYDGIIQQGVLHGNLHFTGTGDPTLGSGRWIGTTQDKLFEELISALQNTHIHEISGMFLLDDSKFTNQAIPDGWIWQDIGNYYGAGSWAINWRENQYDLVLQSGTKIGDSTRILSMSPFIQLGSITNQIKTGEKGSGDNGYIYLPPYSDYAFTSGTIPLGEKPFTISGSMPYPTVELLRVLQPLLVSNHITVDQGYQCFIRRPFNQSAWPEQEQSIMRHYSPTLDSMNYWFLKKSINLYGEALVKTIAYEKTRLGSTEKGVELVKQFWNEHGIEPSALNIIDGSGLSPQNRVTAEAMVIALQYAATRPWFHSFYAALPEINGMKMKSGYISGVRSYAGYQSASNGQSYIFAIMVNNFDDSSSNLMKKIWELLDILK